MAIRVLIADDDALIREGLKIILSMDNAFEIAACVENGLQAVEYCRKEAVDVALLDVRMPVLNGVEAAREISGQTTAKPLILTTFDDDEFITEAIKNGAKGYLLKNNPPDKIKDAIRMVCGGHTVMQDVVLDKLKEGLSTNHSRKFDRSLFSERELEIIELIAKGFANKEIAKKLYISEGTVKNYILTGAFAIRNEKTLKTAGLLLCAPVGKYELLVGKTLGALVITLIQVMVVLLFSKYFLKTYWGEHLGTIFLLASAEVVMAVSLGVGVAFLLRSEASISGVLNMVIPGLAFFGGGYIPLDGFNKTVLLIANASPLRWINKTVMAVIYANDFSSVAAAIVFNLGLGAVFLSIAAYAIRREGALV